jgi:RNA-directed DNA polymerase
MPPASPVSAGGKTSGEKQMLRSKSALLAVSDKEFLRKAWREISKRNMRSKGLDNITIRAFKNRLDENLQEISAALRAQKYEFGKLRAHAITKPGSPKKRPLQIASVRDRVVMKALALFIEPAFTKFNLPCSFAFIKSRGVRPTIERIHELVEGGNRFYSERAETSFALPFTGKLCHVF